VTDVYTKGGDGVETWEPRFTYHGFRFVEVTGWPGKPTLDDIEGRVVHDDVRRAGDFACSNPLINQIYKNIVWGTRGNYRSMPTDCPQRDERQGWLGDRGEESRGEMYLYDNAALMSKWLCDMADSQKDTGSVPDVCPAHWPIYSDNVTWPSTTVILPSSLLRQFGDAEIIGDHYDSAKKWVDYMLTFVKDGIIDRDSYGDWCVPPEDPKLIHSQDPARQTNKALLATSYLYYDLRLMERYAKQLEQSEDAARFGKLADDLKAAFNKKFYNRELGQYDNGSQTSCVLPLYFGLVPQSERQRVFDRLVRKITQETNNHIGTGLIGGQFLNRVLSDNGRADLAYTIAAQKDYPSWGYMVGQGATTVWELWNGDTADPAMNSGNHLMLVGDLAIWLYESLAGIRPDDLEPGFKHIIMRPEVVAGLDWVQASHRSPYGLIESSWQKKGAALEWKITIPPGATATVSLPAADPSNAKESGGPLPEAEGVEVVGVKDGRIELRLGSGKYDFESKL
jgi:alpha-L-rhamnosidase